jgi:hypothetical protein
VLAGLRGSPRAEPEMIAWPSSAELELWAALAALTLAGWFLWTARK